VKIQPQWVVTAGKQTNKQTDPAVINAGLIMNLEDLLSLILQHRVAINASVHHH